MGRKEKQIDGTEFACLTINAWNENELKQKDEKIADLQSQLAEKDKEIEILTTSFKQMLKEDREFKDKQYKETMKDIDTIERLQHNQNQKAIEQLEKVKELIRNIDMPNKPELYNNDMFCAGFDSHYIKTKKEIDGQIEQLKKGMK